MAAIKFLLGLFLGEESTSIGWTGLVRRDPRLFIIMELTAARLRLESAIGLRESTEFLGFANRPFRFMPTIFVLTAVFSTNVFFPVLEPAGVSKTF